MMGKRKGKSKTTKCNSNKWGKLSSGIAVRRPHEKGVTGAWRVREGFKIQEVHGYKTGCQTRTT